MVHICKMMISSGVFFHFYLILIFWAVKEVKEKKLAQNEKQQLHLLHAICQEQYSIWSWFLVHLFKMMRSPGFFLIFFLILIFCVVRGVKGQKTVQNDKKFCFVMLHIIIWFSFMVQICKMIISPSVFFNVKILIFQIVKGLNGQKMA